MTMIKTLARLSALVATSLLTAGVQAGQINDHQMATKYSTLTQINRDNVTQLEQAWEFHTGEPVPTDTAGAFISMQDQPTLIDGNLVVCSAKRRLIALDPATGLERWSFDGGVAPELSIQKCRGVGHWVDPEAADGAVCKLSLFLGTADYRLAAIDAKTGKSCPNFGDNGFVKMPVTKPELFPGEVVAGSDPVIVNGVVVVGSSVADNQRVDPPSGRVLAFDGRTGKMLWDFDPVPRDPKDPAMASWKDGTDGIGQGNVWSSMAADDALDLVYLPTTSPSSDFFGGGRIGDNNYTTSVVALKGSTGEVVWHFQFVHHNVFDYDVPTRPMLIDYPHNGKMVPALVQNTKMGLIFVFDRATGEPLVPIEERPVPQSTVPGEVLSPTQPFPVGMPPLVKTTFTPDDAWGFTPLDKWLCKRKIESLQHGGLYTPPSFEGSVFSPAASGGPNWGGAAYDPQSNIMVVPTSRVPMIVKLIPQDKVKVEASSKIETTGSMTFPVSGSPYAVEVEPLMSIFGAPCVEPPWAALTAIDLVKKEIVWEVPLGSIEKLVPFPLPVDMNIGTPGAGSPLLTAGGLVFIGYTLDDTIRAFDVSSGKVLWQAPLPAAGAAIPVTYEVNGEQYVVIPAGGHSMYGSTMGDSIVAFKLKR